ncbi:methyltransferase [Pseudonocardia sp. MH-G8]|uniref:methyltransferase n=1 Tax=Pseudonocardia sp. MH-G8 TaxID=1854588 RepID=UPI000BA023AC|nr:methyltransferase [Pseudonocardia sp. MH-G8]OZM81563.1 methyltransferase [Pseudonocardia sp. MH-G8]
MTASEQERVAGLVFGFFPAQVVQTLARLGVPDALGEGALGLDALAARTGSRPGPLARLLRAAIGLDLVTPADDGYALTDGGQLLRTGTPGSMGNLAQLFCGDAVWRAWGELEWSVRTGEPSFEKLTGHSSFAHFAADPALNAIFTEAMAEGTRRAAPGIVAACDLTGVGTLADVGGGNGTLLAAFLDAHPELHGILFDTPSGATDLVVDQRCEVVTGDFFGTVPAADAYVVKSVIHDWDDERSVAILARIREAMPPHGVVLVVEPVFVDEPAALAGQRTLLMSDLNMLTCTGGKERTEEEFTALLSAAGLRLVGVTPAAGSGYSVLRAVPA